MAISKGVGGYVFNSQALVADAFHALTDMVSDIMTLATVSFALKDPTSKFPNGYGKIESLGSLGVSALLLTAGIAMGYSSLVDLLHDFLPQVAAYLPHVHHHDHGIPDLNAAWLAGLSILLKEYLYRATMKIAISKKSSVLASNAVHHRVDSLTAIVALLAIAGSNIWTSAGWLDPVGGLLVAGMVISAGGQNTMSALNELADKGIDMETKTEVRKKVEDVFSGGEEVRDVSGIKSGQNFLVHVVVAVRPDATVAELREVEESVRGAAAGVRGVWRVDVKFVDRTRTESASVFVSKKENDEGKAE